LNNPEELNTGKTNSNTNINSSSIGNKNNDKLLQNKPSTNAESNKKSAVLAKDNKNQSLSPSKISLRIADQKMSDVEAVDPSSKIKMTSSTINFGTTVSSNQPVNNVTTTNSQNVIRENTEGKSTH
jgi:hypothetical protein